MRSPLGDPVRSESVAGMDMLNDMFQRQARRLEAQLYQRAQDQRTIEVTQRQAQIARAQVRRLEQTHCEQAARILQGAKSLQQLQQLIRETLHVKQEVLGVCEELEREAAALREALGRVAPGEAEKLPHRRAGSVSVEALRDRAGDLERQLADTERSALQQWPLIKVWRGATRSNSFSRDCRTKRAITPLSMPRLKAFSVPPAMAAI